MKRIRNQYRRPKVPWNTQQIEERRALLKKYGLRRQREIHAAQQILRRYRERARQLNAAKNKAEEKILIDKLVKLGLLQEGKVLDDVLALEINNILDRRLQTIVFKKGYAKTLKQARQLVVHGRVTIDGRRTNIPSYIVPAVEEGKIIAFKVAEPPVVIRKAAKAPAPEMEELEAPEIEEVFEK